MELLVLASTLSFMVVGGLVGVRLLLLSRRTHQLPELAIGLGLVLIAPVGYPLMLAATVPDLFPVPAARLLYAASMLVTAVGSSAIFVFTWRVFRPSEAWGAALAAVCIVALLVQGVASSLLAFLVPTLEMMNQASLWFATRQAAIMLSYGWTAVESIRYVVLMRRRRALGLADPVIANRFLLWGVAGVLSFTASGVMTAVVLAGGDPVHSALARVAIGAGGFFVSVSLYLAFMPPAAYLRWVGAASARATS